MSFRGEPGVYDVYYADQFKGSKCGQSLPFFSIAQKCRQEYINQESVNGVIIVPRTGECDDLRKTAGKACGYISELSAYTDDLTGALSTQNYQDALNDYTSLSSTQQLLVFNNYQRSQYGAAQVKFDAEALVLACEDAGGSQTTCDPSLNTAGPGIAVTTLTAASQFMQANGTSAEQSAWASYSPACQTAAANSFFQAAFNGGIITGTPNDLINWAVADSQGPNAPCAATPIVPPDVDIGLIALLLGTGILVYLILSNKATPP